jgi:allophanate hydrolase subunit 1
MFLYLGTVAGSRVNLTMLVAWEESLLDIVDAVPAQDHMVVYRVERGQSNSLVFKNVHRLWVPTAEESAQGIGAVLEVDGVFGVVDPDMRPLASDECRTLV